MNIVKYIARNFSNFNEVFSLESNSANVNVDSCNGLAPNRRQSIAYNVDLDLWRHVASLGL